MDLIEAGAVDGSAKSYHPGKVVSSFIMGSRRLYDFVDDNALIEMHPVTFTNDPECIARNDRMVSVNSAIEIDLTGQVCADSIGHQLYSGIGGQLDFIRGAARSNGGRSIIALPSTAKDGAVSRIVAELRPGAGVVTTRGDVHFVATEYGIADLHGRTLRDRAKALIAIAHPAFREQLEASARSQHLL
jgi:acetyl-CoA hydrolase